MMYHVHLNTLRLIHCSVALLLFIMFPKTDLQAETYFVATDGDDSNPGTIDKPLASLQEGHDRASAGDTVYLRGGTYTVKQPASQNFGIIITKSGKSDNERIYYWAYEDEIPVLDFGNLNLRNIGAGIRVQGGEWLHFKGLEICNVKAQTGGNNGIWCNPCTHNIFEQLNFHHCEGPGLSIANGEGDLLILNCDSHDNYDKNNRGEDADGFGVHYQTKGDTIRFIGCRAWWCSDDGYDLFRQQFPVIVENCWAFGNGYINQGTGNGGNGSGFKMGNSFQANIRHTIRNCVSWGNKNQGFYANHSPGGTNWYNNTSYKNGHQFDLRSDVNISGDLLHVLRNNIAFPKSLSYPENGDMEFNTWNLNITPSEDDFESVDDEGALGARNEDGSLPDIPFLKLKEGSNLIDKGTDIGLPFGGEAPDLGAYETGLATAVHHAPKILHNGITEFNSKSMNSAVLQYFDINGRKLSPRYLNTGVNLVICRNPDGQARLHLSTSLTRTYERGEK